MSKYTTPLWSACLCARTVQYYTASLHLSHALFLMNQLLNHPLFSIEFYKRNLFSYHVHITWNGLLHDKRLSPTTNIVKHRVKINLFIQLIYNYKLWSLLSTTTTTTVLWSLYTTTSVSRQPQLRSGGFCWSNALLPACPC